MNNPFFYGGYQPPQPPQQQQQGNAPIWVQGLQGAKSFLVAPNTTVQLWDTEAQSIYLKSADASGMPSIKILDYKVRENTPSRSTESAQPTSYVTVEQFHILEQKLADLDALVREKGINE